eukprot:scaffold43037_cov28-Tisochrysis_lutea.AAC.3
MRAPEPSSPKDSRSDASVDGIWRMSRPTGSSTVGGRGITTGLFDNSTLRWRSEKAALRGCRACPAVGLLSVEPTASFASGVLLKVILPRRPSEVYAKASSSPSSKTVSSVRGHCVRSPDCAADSSGV